MVPPLPHPPLPPQVHFFNSFFYDKLRTRGYEGVQRWTKNVRAGPAGGGAWRGGARKGRGLAGRGRGEGRDGAE